MKKSVKKDPVVKASKTTKATKAAKPVGATKKPAAPAKKKSAAVAEPPVTFISAQIDIGFGNHLAIRGTGPGLSWDDGVVMECAGPTLWTFAVPNATAPVTFKVLVNDLNWSTGPDYIVEPGKSITISPTF